MIEILKTEFYREKEILESETSIAEKKYRSSLEETRELKKDFEAKSIRSISLVENEQKYLAALSQDGGPICPRCLVRFDKTHFMSTSPGNDKFDYLSCKNCGLEIEIKI